MSFKQFGWVPDGTYDFQEYLVRYVIKDGNATTVMSKIGRASCRERVSSPV